MGVEKKWGAVEFFRTQAGCIYDLPNLPCSELHDQGMNNSGVGSSLL